MTTSIPIEPLILPKFTFLCGPPQSGQNELAAELSKLDPELGLFDFREPLRMATHGLMFGGYQGSDLPDTILSTIKNTILSKIKMPDWLDAFEEFLDRMFGLGALGRFAAEDYRREGEIYDRLLFRDATTVHDITSFLQELEIPKADALCIHVGPLRQNDSEAARHIWLPEPDTSKRLVALRRELKTLNTLQPQP